MNTMRDLLFIFSPPSDDGTAFHRAIRSAVLAAWVDREARLRVCVKPRPRWMPERVWRWLVGRLIFLEEIQAADGEVSRVGVADKGCQVG